MQIKPPPARALARLAVLFAFGLCAAGSQAQDAPGPKLPAVQLQSGMHLIHAEVARTPQQRATGLMLRKTLGTNEGMLFVFERPGVQCFWMKNTLLPLSIAFLKDDGEIVNIADMQPGALESHCSKLPVRLALEMNQGWFAKRGVAAGSRLGGAGLDR